MKKKIVFVVIMATIFNGGLAVAAPVSDDNLMAYDYIKFQTENPERFKYHNTLTITRVDVKNNRIFVLFDAEYFLRMDERRQFAGGSAVANGVSELVLGWADNDYLMSGKSLGSSYRGGQHELYERSTLFRERLDYYGSFQIPDMIEVELPAKMLRANLASNRYRKLYFYLEAFGYFTDGFIDYSTCFDGVYYGSECVLMISGGELRYGAKTEFTLRRGFIEAGGELETAEPEVMEPEPVIAEPEPEVAEPELVIAEPEPELEIVELEPEEPVLEVVEPEEEPEPEPTIEVAAVPISKEAVEPENDKIALELGLAALVAEIKPTGGETATSEEANYRLLAPNTGYKNQRTAWEFLVFPLVGAAFLAIWWFWPFKKLKKVKKSLKKVLTFFANSDKMITVY